MQNTSARPTGVTIIAVLAIIGGIFGILAGVAVLGLGGLATAAGGTDVGVTAILFGLLLLVVAIGELAFGIGAWGLKPWAWTLGVGIMAASIVISLLSGLINGNLTNQIVSIVIDAIVIYYLFTPGVKAAFGKA